MATINTFMSDIFFGEVLSTDSGFNVKEGVVTWSAKMTAGTAVKLVAGKYVAATSADDADIVGVVADYRALPSYKEISGFTVGIGYPMVIGIRGLTVNATKFVYADGTPVSDVGIAAFEAFGTNKVTDKYLANTSIFN